MAKDGSTITLIDVLGFNQKNREELLERFGKSAGTWEDIKGWDDCVIPEEKAIIEWIKEQRGENCPYLGTKGKYFNFCEVRKKAHEKLGHKSGEFPSPSDAQYQSKVGHYEIQLWCMNGERFCNCMEYQQEQRENN